MGTATFAQRLYGQWVKEARLKQGLTQCQLSKRIRAQGGALCKDTISRVEKGEFGFRSSTMLSLSRALGIDLNEFMKELGRLQKEKGMKQKDLLAPPPGKWKTKKK